MMTLWHLKKTKLNTPPFSITSKGTQVILVRYPKIINYNTKDSNNNALHVSLTDATGINNLIKPINLQGHQSHMSRYVLMFYGQTAV